MGRFFTGLVAGLICIGAGVYLLAHGGQDIDLGNGQTGQSWLEILAHGLGIYMIGKGVFIWGAIWYAADTAEATRTTAGLEK